MLLYFSVCIILASCLLMTLGVLSLLAVTGYLLLFTAGVWMTVIERLRQPPRRRWLRSSRCPVLSRRVPRRLPATTQQREVQ